MLNTRPKWTDVVKDLKKGDIVLVWNQICHEGSGHWAVLWIHIRGKMDIPESCRFSVEKRLWCDQFINWYHSCDLLDF